MTLIERLEKRELYFRHAVEGEYDADLLRKARFELEANAAEIGRLREALRDLLTAVDAADSVKRGDFYHERKAARAALNKQESGNV